MSFPQKCPLLQGNADPEPSGQKAPLGHGPPVTLLAGQVHGYDELERPT